VSGRPADALSGRRTKTQFRHQIPTTWRWPASCCSLRRYRRALARRRRIHPPRESRRARPLLDHAGLIFHHAEDTMTTEERTEDRTRYEVLFEDMKKQFGVIMEAQAACAEDAKQHRAETNQRFEKVERELIRLDVKIMNLDAKVNTLDAKVNTLDTKVNTLDAKVDKIEQKIGALDVKLSTELARIAAHLGINGASPPAGPP
jgi:hypothetical protein